MLRLASLKYLGPAPRMLVYFELNPASVFIKLFILVLKKLQLFSTWFYMWSTSTIVTTSQSLLTIKLLPTWEPFFKLNRNRNRKAFWSHQIPMASVR